LEDSWAFFDGADRVSAQLVAFWTGVLKGWVLDLSAQLAISSVGFLEGWASSRDSGDFYLERSPFLSCDIFVPSGWRKRIARMASFYIWRTSDVRDINCMQLDFASAQSRVVHYDRKYSLWNVKWCKKWHKMRLLTEYVHVLKSYKIVNNVWKMDKHNVFVSRGMSRVNFRYFMFFSLYFQWNWVRHEQLILATWN